MATYWIWQLIKYGNSSNIEYGNLSNMATHQIWQSNSIMATHQIMETHQKIITLVPMLSGPVLYFLISFHNLISCHNWFALAAWHSGHRVHLQNRRSQVQIPLGCKVLGIYTMQCCCHNLICIVIVCTWENKCFKIFKKKLL
jgi:hypothetical protein